MWTSRRSEKDRALSKVRKTLNYLQQEKKWACWFAVLIQPVLHIKKTEDAAVLSDGFGCQSDLSFKVILTERLRERRPSSRAQLKSQLDDAGARTNLDFDGVRSFKKSSGSLDDQGTLPDSSKPEKPSSENLWIIDGGLNPPNLVVPVHEFCPCRADRFPEERRQFTYYIFGRV